MRQHTRKSMEIANIPPNSTSKTTFFGTSSMANLRRSSFNSGCRAQTFGSWWVSKLREFIAWILWICLLLDSVHLLEISSLIQSATPLESSRTNVRPSIHSNHRVSDTQIKYPPFTMNSITRVVVYPSTSWNVFSMWVWKSFHPNSLFKVIVGMKL